MGKNKEVIVTAGELVEKLKGYPKDAKIIFIDEAIDFLHLNLARVDSTTEIKTKAESSSDPIEKNYYQALDMAVLAEEKQEVVVVTVFS